MSKNKSVDVAVGIISKGGFKKAQLQFVLAEKPHWLSEELQSSFDGNVSKFLSIKHLPISPSNLNFDGDKMPRSLFYLKNSKRYHYRIFRFNLTEKQSQLLLSKSICGLYVAIQKPQIPILDEKEILGKVVNIEQHPSFIKVTVKFFNFRVLQRTFLCDPNITLTASYFRPAGSNLEISNPPIFALDMRSNRAEQTNVRYRSGWDATVVTSIPEKWRLMLHKKTRGLRGSRRYVKVFIS